jgi:hypothetical protein
VKARDENVIGKPYQSGALIVASNNSLSRARVTRLTASLEAPSTGDKNCSLYAPILIGFPNSITTYTIIRTQLHGRKRSNHLHCSYTCSYSYTQLRSAQ